MYLFQEVRERFLNPAGVPYTDFQSNVKMSTEKFATLTLLCLHKDIRQVHVHHRSLVVSWISPLLRRRGLTHETSSLGPPLAYLIAQLVACPLQTHCT